MTIHDTNAPATAIVAATNGDASNEGEEESQQSIPPEMANTKHPLQYSWTLWYYKNDRSKSWQDNLREESRLQSNRRFPTMNLRNQGS